MADKVIWCEKGFFPVRYGFCPSERAWTRLMKDLNIPYPPPPYPDNTAARCTTFHNSKTNKSCCIVTVTPSEEPTCIQLAGILVHEATHIWQEIREQMGEASPSQEFEAYSIQFITEELLYAWDASVGQGRLAAASI